MSTIGVWGGLLGGLANVVMFLTWGTADAVVSLAFCLTCAVVSALLWLGQQVRDAARQITTRGPASWRPPPWWPG